MSDFLRNLSVFFSHYLNVCGIWKKKEFRKSEILLLEHIDITAQAAGSYSEGTELESSDWDEILVHFHAIAVTNRKQVPTIPNDKVVLLMCQDNFRPCYPVLEVLTPDRHVEAKHNVLKVLNFVKSLQINCNQSKQYVSSKEYLCEFERMEANGRRKSKHLGITRNGPCVKLMEHCVTQDRVFIIPCCKWPPIALEWIIRERKFGWPDIDLINKVVKTKCALAPIGDQFSDYEDIQWRISFTQGERLLIWSLNRQQFHCFIVFKIIMKHYFKSENSSKITSFMLKTTFFWYVENTAMETWTDDNLLLNVQQCIGKLIQYINAKNMPHFFVPENNIILHMYDDEDIRNASDQLCYISKKIHILIHDALSVPEYFLNRFPMNIDSTDFSIPLKKGYYSYFFHNQIESICDDVEDCDIEVYVTNMLNIESSSILKEHIEIARRMVCRKLANECCYLYCRNSNHLTEGEKDMLLQLAEDCYKAYTMADPISGNLILATFYLWTEHLDILRQCLNTLDVTGISLYFRYVSRSVFVTLNPEITNLDSSLVKTGMFNSTCIRDVSFLFFDKRFIPSVISCELDYYPHLNIYPPVYFRFAQFLLAKADGSIQLQFESLYLLSAAVKMTEGGRLTDISYNILGYCHMIVAEYEPAIRCFYQSYKYIGTSRPHSLNPCLYHSLVTIWRSNNKNEDCCCRTFPPQLCNRTDKFNAKSVQEEMNRLQRIASDIFRFL